MTYRPPSTKCPNPPPRDFAEVYVRGGWQLVEHLLGARTDTHVKWLALVGADRVRALRREYLKGDSTAIDRARLLAQR